MKKTLILSLSALIMSSSNISARKLSYPQAPAGPVVDTYFGTTVVDLYRPLENDTAAATTAWVEAENALTADYLSRIPFRDKIRARLIELNNYHKRGLPWRGNDGLYYYSDNDGLRNQSVLYRKATLDGEPELFLDPNTLSDDGTVALTGLTMSRDGKYTAYTISRSGSDWTEIYVIDTATGRLLPDHIEWAKFTEATWTPDGSGFYYSAYDRPEAGKEVSDINLGHRIYFHRLGTPQSDDTVVYEDKDHPYYFHSAWIPDSEDYLVVTASGSGPGNALKIKDLKDPDADWIVMEESQDIPHGVVDIREGKIYIVTSLGAPRYRLMVADVDAPQRDNWRELVAESDGVLTGAAFTSGHMILSYEKDASTHLYLHDKDTAARIKEIELPTYGSAGLSVSPKYPEIFYSFTTFNRPNSHYSYDPASGNSTLLYTPAVNGIDPDDYVTEQVFFPSADGTMVPMFLTYKKGLKRDGSNPVYLYGYGGFNISLTPGFSPNRMLWLENGGIYAQTNLRGGSEYGDQWHEAGTKLNKLNVFNDFIAAAEYMIREGWTTPDNLVCEGGSNGGLLVGATVNMRPDLFKVAIPRVGVMDMMRYHLFTIGWNWASDYGTSADSPEMAAYLHAYSPMHNIKNDGTPYPAILVTTADHDDRVVPAHSFKYAAMLQAADTGDAPKLIRIDSKAGHGGGKPIGKVIDEYTDIYSFIFHNLGREVK